MKKYIAELIGLTMAYAIGHISGCHLNPAVSIGLWAGGRFSTKLLLPYILAQVVGGILAGGLLYMIVSSQTGFESVGGFASNGFGESGSPQKFNMVAIFADNGGLALQQLWLFWVAPIAGGFIGATIYRFVSSPDKCDANS